MSDQTTTLDCSVPARVATTTTALALAVELPPPPYQAFHATTQISMTPSDPLPARRLLEPVLVETSSSPITTTRTATARGSTFDLSNAHPEPSFVSSTTTMTTPTTTEAPSSARVSLPGETNVTAEADAHETVPDSAPASAVVVITPTTRAVYLENNLIAVQVANETMAQMAIIMSVVVSLMHSVACGLFALWMPTEQQWGVQAWTSMCVSGLIWFWWANAHSLVRPENRKPFLGWWFGLEAVIRLAVALGTKFSASDLAAQRLHDLSIMWCVTWSGLMLQWMASGCVVR